MAKALTFDTVCEMALALPGVEIGTGWGQKVLKVRGKLMVCPAINKSAEPGTLGFKIGFSDRERLMAEKPAVFYLTDHYVNYPSVLMRLARATRNDVQGVLLLSWEFSGGALPPKAPRKRAAPKKKPARKR
jgi:hypothetical protein